VALAFGCQHPRRICRGDYRMTGWLILLGIALAFFLFGYGVGRSHD
jgi:hypothetical protein